LIYQEIMFGAISNSSILQLVSQRNMIRNTKILDELRVISPCITDEVLLQIYKKSISIHQKNAQGNGAFLENDIIKDILDKAGVSYRSQVSIDKEGVIFGFNQKKSKCYHIVDFVIGDSISVDRNIHDFTVLSCKTTCRERWTQDDWSLQMPPKKYILITLSNDYPPSKRFREAEDRKIVTCIPKARDDRIYKLGFEDLLSEIY